MKLSLSTISFLFLFFCLSCKNNITNDAYEYCDLSQPNSGFMNSDLGMPFAEVEESVGAGGEVSGGFLTSDKTAARYVWTYCGYQYEIYIQCEFYLDKLILMQKTFRDTICGNKINAGKFDKIKKGDTYEKMVSLLASNGDLMEKRYLHDNEVFTKYHWYDCLDTYRYIEGDFVNNILQKKKRFF